MVLSMRARLEGLAHEADLEFFDGREQLAPELQQITQIAGFLPRFHGRI